ncbi:MAG: hypothetical protein A3J48_01875 [Candidatus Doudnabacteria bacterium RIFCSPHIGHO2_02_FULL_46_11]|uniref:Chorismate mutase domain-containing protein n=1 Tax=Candidatus Doudnabacteria bacterium RIFCSPHIGHO2_02_FULL_46_11 TaxID=1817832 RepID=A0A1F5P9N4_9BACT|nr:MAG: hypothetical protein A3J48_01875 [Candidatus Doudnabacteria bacterium RIFCSPHIGHO2_02_FULL_46_11]
MTTQIQAPVKDLSSLRAQVEELDQHIISLLRARVCLAREIDQAKRETGQPVADHAQEAVVMRRATGFARQMELDPEMTREIYWKVVALCRPRQ